MDNKYFTPDIEDIHIGYECEIYDQSTSKLIKKVEWHIVKTHLGNSEIGKNVAINQVLKYIKQNKLRVPYLTKEQIEAEGWVEMSPPIISISREFRNIPFIKDGYRLDYNLNSNQLAITVNDQFLFYGECPSINELRIICKLLNIK